MFNNLKCAIAFSTFAFLAACGGGGSSTPTNTGPVASTATFNLLVANAEYSKKSSTTKFTISGTTGAGVSVTGSGTGTTGTPSSATFEGKPALKSTSVLVGSWSGNGKTIPLNSSSDSFMDSNYLPLGSSGSEYEVITGTPTLPTAARVNDTGSIYTANRYTNSSKTTLLGTKTIAYVIEADTASTALVTLINTEKDTTGKTTSVFSEQFRITTANILTPVKDTGFDYTTGLNLTLTYQ